MSASLRLRVSVQATGRSCNIEREKAGESIATSEVAFRVLSRQPICGHLRTSATHEMAFEQEVGEFWTDLAADMIWLRFVTLSRETLLDCRPLPAGATLRL